MKKSKGLLVISAFVVFLSLIVTGCASKGASSKEDNLKIGDSFQSGETVVNGEKIAAEEDKADDESADPVTYAYPRNEVPSSEYEEFKKLLEGGDPQLINDFLMEWEASKPLDPEFFGASFEFYSLLSRTMEKKIMPSPPTESGVEYQEVIEPETGTKFYVYDGLSHIPEYQNEAIRVLKAGISLYPDRLDYWVPLISYLMESGYNNGAANVSMDMIKRSGENNNNWYVINNQPFSEIIGPDIDKFLVGTIEELCLRPWLNNSTEESLGCAVSVLKVFVEYMPYNDVQKNNLGFVYNLSGNYTEALNVLLPLYEKCPENIKAVYNIATAYDGLGDRENAVKYADILINSGDSEYVEIGSEIKNRK